MTTSAPTPTLELDERALSAELASAVISDQRRKDVDDMKKRAVMTSRSYDEFRHLVACAETGQKPLSSKELASLGKPAKPEDRTFNGARSRTKNGGRNRRGVKQNGVALSGAFPTKAPSTAQQFQRDWRRNCRTALERFRYLLLIPPETLPSIFKVEIHDFDGILAALAAGIQEPAESVPMLAVLEVLAGLTRVGRFSLEVDFLGKVGKESALLVFEALGRSKEITQDRLSETRAAFCLTDGL